MKHMRVVTCSGSPFSDGQEREISSDCVAKIYNFDLKRTETENLDSSLIFGTFLSHFYIKTTTEWIFPRNTEPQLVPIQQFSMIVCKHVKGFFAFYECEIQFFKKHDVHI